MYCRNCSKQIDDKAIVCVHCGVSPKSERKYCDNCGVATESNQTVCVKCGVAFRKAKGEKDKMVAGLLAIFAGGLGAHKFYLGYNNEAVILLVIFWGGLFLFGCPSGLVAMVVLAEGIIYLTKSDEEFQSIYVDNKKPWF